MSAIKTWTGRYVDPLNMTVFDVCIEDIAHALARTCRYGGHCNGFLSVARHSVWVADLLRAGGETATTELWGLLHDAPEAYLGDVPRPIKHAAEFQAYRTADESLERVVATAFALPFPMPTTVKDADQRVLYDREMSPAGARDTYDGDYYLDERVFLERYHDLVAAVLAGK